MTETLLEQLRKKAKITCDIAGGVCWEGEPKVPNERCVKCNLLLEWVKLDDVLKIVEEMTKDLVLPNYYKHRTRFRRDKVIKSTVFLDEDLEKFKAKLKNWLGVPKK